MLIVVLLLAGAPGFAASSSADAAHVHVQLVAPSQSIAANGRPAKAGLYFKLEPGWHVYWKNAGDAGEPPRIKWTLPQGISASALLFPVPKRLPVGPLMDFGYENEVLFSFSLTAGSDAKPGPVTLQAHVNWLVCREVCIPGKADLAITRAVGDAAGAPIEPDAGLYARLADKLPAALPAKSKLGFVSTPAGFKLTVETGRRETEASFFPADQDVIQNAAPQKVTPTAKGLTLEIAKDANLAKAPDALRGVIELSGGRAYEIAAPQGAVKAGQAQASGAEAPSPAAADAGAKAPAYPKADAAAPAATGTNAPAAGAPSAPAWQGAGPRAATQPGFAKVIALAFLGGIILNLMPCVFPVLFLKGLALVNSGAEERHRLRAHGLVYTAGIVVSFWALVGLLLGLRAAGARLGWGFQFQSPVFLFLMAGLLFFLGLSLAGQFEIGLSLTSTGGSLAQKQGYTGSFFTGVLAVIVATPCTAPFMGAAIGYALAAPAIATFAVFTMLALGLAAPYLVLTLQPAWTHILPRPGAWMEVLRQAVSVPIFGTVIWLAWVVANAYGATMLAALLASFLLLAIAGWFLGRWPAKAWSAVLAGVIILCVIGLGMYSSLELAPDNTIKNLAREDGPYAQSLILPAGTVWEQWSSSSVSEHVAAGTPVFVDFTAKWCLSCQVNERVALTRPEVMKAFADAHVALLKADWTQHDDAISQELERLGRSGVPVYALYVPGEATPRLLPEALTPGIVLEALNSLPRNSTQTAAAPSK
ncbi:protein-disulfide reductase DsbD family protein [Occallatibacter riparius]|uniref:Thioredoxin family protein n=1 Tax=Occallatibacter riparius TaxID=1002689 RepID=A0A9J7BN33_9BACT|nr:protein-disulfide reductase DsbD domain-containing protein [Occallatibacter riparius]UWZ83170.1 thioredoxin family protein [Occallatibacter riparius]